MQELDAKEPVLALPRLSVSAWVVVTLGIMSAFGPMGIDMYLPAMPRMALDLGVPVGHIQLTLPVFLLGLAAGQVFCGTISDYLGRRGPLLAGCICFAGAAAVCACSSSLVGLVVFRFLMGLGGSAGIVLARAVVRDLCDENESARLYSMMMIIGGIAPIIAPFLGGILLTYANWRVVFWVISGFGMLCLLTASRNLPETLPRSLRSRGSLSAVLRGYGSVLAHRQFIAYAIGISFSSGMLFAYISGSPIVFIQIFGVSPQKYSYIFAGNAIGLYCGGQLNRWLLRRFSARQILGRACAVNLALTAALFVAAWTGWGSMPLFMAILFLCVASLSMVFPNATAVAMKPFPSQAGSASACLGLMQYLVGAAAGSAVGLLANGTAIPMVGLIVACSALASTALLGLARVFDPAK